MPDLVILAAGMGTRYGGLKQLASVGPSGEALLHYAIYDAVRAGFERVILVIRPELEAAFRERVTDPLGDVLDVRLVHQEPPEGRRKPWGTGHALLAARDLLERPFGVCNADDFYGAEAHRLVADHLARAPEQGVLVGYRLGDTLSSAGGVSRAVCQVDEAGRLRRVIEVRDIAEQDDTIAGVDLDGARHVLAADALISTNYWGLPPSALPRLADGFTAFRTQRPGPTDEYLLSTAVDGMIRGGEFEVRVLRTSARFLGITRVPDQGDAASGLRALTEAGAYPVDIIGALHRARGD
jgi:hypothetical protein